MDFAFSFRQWLIYADPGFVTHFDDVAVEQMLRQCPVSRNPQGVTIITDGKTTRLIEIYENANADKSMGADEERTE